MHSPVHSTALAEDRRSRQGHLTFQGFLCQVDGAQAALFDKDWLQVDVACRNDGAVGIRAGLAAALGRSSGSTSGAGPEPTRAIKGPCGMVTEELPLAHLGGRRSVRCWPRSENGEQRDEFGGDT